MKFKLIFIVSAVIALHMTSCKNAGSDKSKDWELTWSDEFNENGLPDSTRWGYDVGGHGWGNHEKQYYTAARMENARVENGLLIIEARKEIMDSSEYTSARLVTRGKMDWLYGRFEIRAKLPSGRGTWPAIWMLPTQQSYGDNYWPENGEIDIMEHVGFHQGHIHASAHSIKYYWRIGTQRTDTTYSNDVSEKFHDYILEWDPEVMKVYMDDSLFFTSTNDKTGWEAWPFDKPFYLPLNIAVGGDWGGIKGIDESIWPQKMEIDYVRVYKRKQK